MPRLLSSRHLALSLLLASSVLSVGDDESTAIRFDGLYCADDVEGFVPPVNSYLRFYPDGTVVSYAARDTPEEAAKWIRRNDRSASRGHFTVSGAHLTFSVTNENGTVDHSGTIEGGHLLLAWDARNGKKGKEDYRFVRLELPTQ